jgi:uncharacterized membrane protein YkoI
MTMSGIRSRLGILAATGVAATLGAASAHGGISHLEAMAIGQTELPAGTVVRIQDERFDGVEWTYEVDLVINNGNIIAQVEMDADTGAITQYDEFPQTANQRDRWQEIVALYQTATLDYDDAVGRAYSRYPNAEFYEIALDLEVGRLEYDFPLRDGTAFFQIEIDALNGNIDDPDGDGGSINLGEVADLAAIQEPNGVILKITLLQRNGNWEYKTEIAKNGGAREVHIWFDEDTGAVKKRLVRDITGTELQKNQAVLNLLPNANFTFEDSMWLARTKYGNSRMKSIELVVLSGRLKYKAIMIEAAVNGTAKVDARNGNVV